MSTGPKDCPFDQSYTVEHRKAEHQDIMSKRGTCPACGVFGKLLMSHIVPLWMLRDIPSDEDLKVIHAGVVSDHRKEIVFNQDHILVKQRLLCKICEEVLGKYEAELRDRLFGARAEGPLQFCPAEAPVTEVRNGVPRTYWLLANAKKLHLALLGILAKFLEIHPGSAVTVTARKDLWKYVLSEGAEGSHHSLCALVFAPHADISTTSVFISPQEGLDRAIMGFQAGGLKVLYVNNPSFASKYLLNDLLGIMREDLLQGLGPILGTITAQ